MHPDFLATLFDLMAAVLRWLLTWGAHVLVIPEYALYWRFAPIVALPFAAWRSFCRNELLWGVALVSIELYFVFNRLTVFASKPLTFAELLGNLGELLLALLLVLPRRPRQKLPSLEDHPHA